MLFASSACGACSLFPGNHNINPDALIPFYHEAILLQSNKYM